VGICSGNNRRNFQLGLHRFTKSENIAKSLGAALLFWLTFLAVHRGLCSAIAPSATCQVTRQFSFSENMKMALKVKVKCNRKFNHYWGSPQTDIYITWRRFLISSFPVFLRRQTDTQTQTKTNAAGAQLKRMESWR